MPLVDDFDDGRVSRLIWQKPDGHFAERNGQMICRAAVPDNEHHWWWLYTRPFPLTCLEVQVKVVFERYSSSDPGLNAALFLSGSGMTAGIAYYPNSNECEFGVGKIGWRAVSKRAAHGGARAEAHRLRLTYRSESQIVSAFLDDEYLGHAKCVPRGGSARFGLLLKMANRGTSACVCFDDFKSDICLSTAGETSPAIAEAKK